MTWGVVVLKWISKWFIIDVLKREEGSGEKINLFVYSISAVFFLGWCVIMEKLRDISCEISYERFFFYIQMNFRINYFVCMILVSKHVFT